MPSFVESFCDLTKHFESPTSFWKWSAYAAIAATLRYNCYLKWGTSKLYPNLYVLLLANSAAFRKDAAPKLVEELLRECSHTKVMSGRASYQGIVDELSQDIGNKKTGIPIRGGAGIVIALEFTAFFVDDPQLIQLLTEGYAFSEEYEYTLRGGKTKVKNRCLSLLGGSNETLLRDVFTIRANEGGLLRRTLLIKPDGRRPPNSLMEDTDYLNEADKKVLITQLKAIQNLNGEFIKSKEAKEAYTEWYRELYANYDKLEDRSGFLQGCHGLIWKLAMILTAAQNTLLVSEAIISLAIKEVLSLKENYTTYIMGSGTNPHAKISAMILTDLWQISLNGNKPFKRREILLKYWNEISSEDLDKLILTLEGAGLIQCLPSGNEPAWVLTTKAKEIFLKDLKTKSQGKN